MIKQLLAIVAIGTLSIVPFLDNTDYNPWMEGDTYIVAQDGSIKRVSRFDPNWKPQSDYEGYHEELYQQKEQKRKEVMSEFTEATANVCTNGKDHSKLNMVDYINEFINGPCQPAVLVPGLIGTALQVKIDCETKQAKRPDIFENCGWQTCSASKFWLKKPSDEYRMWIGLLSSPFSIAMTSKKDKCFGDFIELYYDKSQQDPRMKYSAAPGIKITQAGNTPKSADTECGTTQLSKKSLQILQSRLQCVIQRVIIPI